MPLHRFFAAVLAYFVVGIIVNYRYKGARGSEVFPNVDFWKDVPFLIKVGLYSWTITLKILPWYLTICVAVNYTAMT